MAEFFPRAQPSLRARRSLCAALLVGPTAGLALGLCLGACASTQIDRSESSRCYPYIAEGRAPCRTSCAQQEDCAGSRGPADFEKNGWPLDCINERCVPLPPDAVYGG